MTGPQVSTQINLDSGLSDLLKSAKSHSGSGQGSIGGKFLDALDSALKRDSRRVEPSPVESVPKPESPSKSPAQDAPPATQASSKNESPVEDQSRVREKTGSDAVARALKEIQNREGPASAEPADAAIRKSGEGKTRKTDRKPAESMAELNTSLVDKTARDASISPQGMPGLRLVQEAGEQPVSRNTRSKDKSRADKSAPDEVLRGKDRKKTRLEGLDTDAARIAGAGLLQGKDGGKAARSDQVPDEASRNLLGKALDTLKSLGAQLGGQKPEFNVREIIPSDLIGRLAGKKNEKADAVAAGSRAKSQVSISLDKEEGSRTSAAKARPGRNGDDLARRVEIQDQRGASLASGSVRNFVQSQDVLAQTLAGVSAGKGKTGPTESPGLDLNVNTAYVPARERVVQMPVMPSAQGGFGQSLKDWMEGKGGQHLASEAKMLLKDGGTGEIRLILHPEEMGEVRINLKLQDGHIAGDIFVENEEVRKAFQDQLESLGEAFRQSGFGDSQFTVALGQQGQQGKGSFSKDPGQEENRQASAYALEKLERQVTVLPSTGYGNSQIDMVV